MCILGREKKDKYIQAQVISTAFCVMTVSGSATYGFLSDLSILHRYPSSLTTVNCQLLAIA